MGILDKTKLPPGPKTQLPLGHLFNFRRDSIAFLKEIGHTYGDIVHFRIGPLRLVLLNHPDLIKEVLTTHHRNFVKGRPLEMAKELLGEGLLTSEGEFHKRQSQIIQPAFHRKMIESYSSAMTEYTLRLMKTWESGMQVDMMEEMEKLSTSIAGKTLFNVDVEHEAPEISEALNVAKSLFGRVSIPFSEWLLKLPIPSTRQFYKAKARLDETIYRIIEERRRNPLDNGDLLSLLLRAQAEGHNGGAVSNQHIRDEALTLFLTALDTTSIALNWTWYLLSQNPEAEAKLHEEIDRELKGRTPTAEDIPRLKYTRMVFGEAMRLFPPVYIISRQALVDFPIDRYVIPAGTIILMSPYLIHHDPRFHPNPEAFNPEAWDQHSNSPSSKYEYFPFSKGPRSCIGESYAWMEGVLVLATIAQSWSIQLVPNHPVALLQLINLRPKHGMKMNLFRRK